MLLNTDWTEAGNSKLVEVCTGDDSYLTPVREREALIITLKDGKAAEERVTL